ncbi:Immune-associated nucleotide-binding protein 4 [Anabarilius grahami]|uniref:Immune-associated nucleotide-binding protein 4 n=1 Tax=Anabarilius grahami TaxID=495550 RepID=A0A3N0Z0C0_ANAGA|nr:Immune-associated nucleotide-binding protein 4 [Anabarilius grahami]
MNGEKVIVIDTPGLFDTSLKIGDLKVRIAELFNHSGDGIHAILLVIKLCTKFTEEERKTVQWIKDNFGEEASKNTIVLFTNGDELEYNDMKITEYINDGENLKKLIDQCNGRYQVFNNRSNDRTQVTELLGKIKEMIKENNTVYTKKKYDETQKKLRIANAVGIVTGGAAGAGVAGGAAAAASATKGIIITAAVVGGAGTAVLAGVVGAGAAIYKYAKRESKPKNKNKDV